MKANQYLRELYLDFFNNYLTIEKFSEDNDLTPFDAVILLQKGERLHEEYVEQMKRI